MIKKIIPLLIMLLCLGFVGISKIPAIADTEKSYNMLEQLQPGVDLGDFDVELGYKNYTLNTSGAFRAVEITFDKAFIDNNYPEVATDENSDILTRFAPFIQAMGYNVTIDTPNNKIIGERKFETLTELIIAMGGDGYDSNKTNDITQKGFFFNDTFSKQNSPFTGIEESEGELKQILDEFYSLGIEREAIILNYTYGTPYKIIKSDADHIVYSASESIYLHSFDMNMDMSGRKINFVRHAPNSAGWYSLAIMIALVVISIPMTILIIRHKKKKKETYYGQ